MPLDDERKEDTIIMDYLCDLCGNNIFEKTIWFFLYRERKYHLVRCQSCSLISLFPKPSDEEIESFYDDDYFMDGSWSGKNTSYLETFKKEKRAFLKRLNHIKKKLLGDGYVLEDGYILEIGCAGGAALETFRDSGYKVCGVELNEMMARWGKEERGLDIMAGRIEEQNFEDDTFDLVFCSDLIEHIPNPNRFFPQIYRILKPGGFLILEYPIEVDNLSSKIESLLLSERQKRLKPYHIFYYTCETMYHMLEKHGFLVHSHINEKRLDINIPAIRFHGIKALAKYTIIDSFNCLITKIFKVWGDRGLSIAQKPTQ